MPSITRVFRNHAAPAYFALTFAISWAGVLLVIAGSGPMPLPGTSPTGDPRFVYALIAMLAGPCLSGLLLTAVLHGRKGLHAYLRRAVTWRVSGRW